MSLLGFFCLVGDGMSGEDFCCLGEGSLVVVVQVGELWGDCVVEFCVLGVECV